MTSVLGTIAKPTPRAPIVTIIGDSGIGKTSLACTFPNPVVIRAEDGLQAVPEDHRPDAFPLLAGVDQLWEQCSALIKEKHSYQTVIIDSVTALERMFITHVVENDEKRPLSINQALGGFGAGVTAVGAMHHRLRKACGIMNIQRGMNVVFVGHADTETIELPDQEEAYTRYSLRLGKKSMAPYVDDSDVVGFIKLETHTFGDGAKKKAVSNGTRLLVTYATAASVSKNRYGITKDLLVEPGKNPFAGVITGIDVG